MGIVCQYNYPPLLLITLLVLVMVLMVGLNTKYFGLQEVVGKGGGGGGYTQKNKSHKFTIVEESFRMTIQKRAPGNKCTTHKHYQQITREHQT